MEGDEAFYGLWFEGVNRFLETADNASVSAFLSSTARSCSESHPRGVYLRAFSGGRTVEEALGELSREFEDFDFEPHDGYADVFYARCGCPLAISGRVRSPRLCDCSAASLLENWEAVLGEGSCRVEPVTTVLGGGERCHFRIFFGRNDEKKGS